LDICIRNETEEFSLRAAALIIQDEKILLIKNDTLNCFYTVGGRIKQNESSEEAVCRECIEEIGFECKLERLVFVQERFYQVNNRKHHETVFFYLMKPYRDEIHNGNQTDQACCRLYWIPIEDLSKLNLVPTFLKSSLINVSPGITHIITKE